MAATYPPEPWHLGARLLLAVHRLPARALPGDFAAAVPAGVQPVRLGGEAVVGVAFVSYAPGSVLVYEELLVTQFARAGVLPVSSIGQIWVDSPESHAGGRALWGIPKHLAAFEREDRQDGVRMALPGTATVDATYGRALVPGVRRVPLHTAQRLEGTDFVVGNRVLTRVHGMRARWTFAPDGPLAWLAGREPFAQVALRDASIVFGADVKRREPARA